MDYTTLNDKLLWERCRVNDERAYSELFERYFSRMLDVANMYVVDSMKAEELVMDCFFNLWDRRAKISIDGDFRSYLFKCVRHSVISHFRREIPLTFGLEQVEATHQTDVRADHRLLRDDVRKIYLTALDKLSPRRREVFMLSREQNLSYSEIAERMSLSVGTVENYMVAAIEGMRANMKGYFPALVLLLAALAR